MAEDKPAPLARDPLDYRKRASSKSWRCLLPLTFNTKTSEWEGWPQRSFKPSGLAIWGAPARAELRHVLIGTDLQVVCNYAPVPARFFAYGESYAQIAAKLDEGLEPPAWCEWKPIELGQLLRLSLTVDEKPLPRGELELAMWGYSFD